MKFTPEINLIFDFVPQVKSIDPVTGSAIIGATNAILGNIFSAVGANKQNKQNLNMMREQNAFNAAEADKQRLWLKQQTSVQNAFNAGEAATARDWQEKMIEQQNIFNSPVNQLKRMREAGLNPALLQMDGSIRSASPTGSPQASAASVGSPSSASAAGAIPAVNPFSNIGNSALAALQAKKLSAEIESIEDENQRKNELHPYEIETAKGNIVLIGSNVKVNEAKVKELEAQIPLIQSTLQKTSEEIAGIALDNEFKKKDLVAWQERYDREVKRWELENDVIIANKNEIYQRISNLISQKNLIDEQVTSQQYRNYLDGFEVKLRKDNEEAILKYMWDTEKARYDLVLEEIEGKKRISEWRNSDKWYWKPLVKQLDFLNMLSESIGMSVSGSASTSQSSSRSVSRSTSSNVSDIFTHKVE